MLKLSTNAEIKALLLHWKFNIHPSILACQALTQVKK
jgi:hypothetical protein